MINMTEEMKKIFSMNEMIYMFPDKVDDEMINQWLLADDEENEY